MTAREAAEKLAVELGIEPLQALLKLTVDAREAYDCDRITYDAFKGYYDALHADLYALRAPAGHVVVPVEWRKQLNDFCAAARPFVNKVEYWGDDHPPETWPMFAPDDVRRIARVAGDAERLLSAAGEPTIAAGEVIAWAIVAPDGQVVGVGLSKSVAIRDWYGGDPDQDFRDAEADQWFERAAVPNGYKLIGLAATPAPADAIAAAVEAEREAWRGCAHLCDGTPRSWDVAALDRMWARTQPRSAEKESGG